MGIPPSMGWEGWGVRDLLGPLSQASFQPVSRGPSLRGSL